MALHKSSAKVLFFKSNIRYFYLFFMCVCFSRNVNCYLFVFNRAPISPLASCTQKPMDMPSGQLQWPP